MTQPDPSDSQQNEPNDEIRPLKSVKDSQQNGPTNEVRKLEQIKTDLESICNALKARKDLNLYNEQRVKELIESLTEKGDSVEILQKSAFGLLQVFDSYLKFLDKIDNALTELFIALHMLERVDLDPENAWRSFYRCLINCRRYLIEALQTFNPEP